ncbi:MAG TPA: SEC-C metal-binding domain-containing protein, partial [Candidatus Paceibacterota bacterium]
TVNDYLARRDAAWMGQVYAKLGLSVGVLNGDASYLYDEGHVQKEEDAARDEEGSFRVFHDYLRPCSRKEAYDADITYGTNSEFGFDYLRDNTAYRQEDLRVRTGERGGYHYAIVDEIDSILIDEARTPLIISAPAQESEDWYRTFASLAAKMHEGVDYEVEEKHRSIKLTDAGIARAEKELGIENIYTEGGIKQVHHLETAVRAKALFRRDKEYVVQGGKVVIVDEFTGRLQPGRRWSEGLHQAVEAKEGVPVERESRTVASITYQNFFRMYGKLAGMTGTGKTSSEEFFKVYGLETVEIPPNRAVVRHDKNDLIFQTEKGKFTALARRVKELHEKGQPVLIGTVSVEKNELLSAFLKREGVPHEILNAKNHEREGEIIAYAGERGHVTVATNMAGRGVDIKLGGTSATKEESEAIKALGGLAVIGTERHEARRIDNQLRGRSGRQGDPGETQFFVSLEDSLMRVFASDMLKGLMGRFGIPEDEPIENGMVTRALETAQTKIEGFNFDARKMVLEYDNVLDRQRTAIYARRRALLLGSADDVEEELDSLAGSLGEEAVAVLRAKAEEIGEDALLLLMRQVMLQTLDMLWMEHLESMEYLRGSVSLRAYGQRDPLMEYRREGLHMFRELEAVYAARIMEIVSKIDRSMIASNPASSGAAPTQPAAPIPPDAHIGRNDPCPCGSGKKYKHCHGK